MGYFLMWKPFDTVERWSQEGQRCGDTYNVIDKSDSLTVSMEAIELKDS